jgi:flavin-dependent dehydrogenase
MRAGKHREGVEGVHHKRSGAGNIARTILLITAALTVLTATQSRADGKPISRVGTQEIRHLHGKTSQASVDANRKGKKPTGRRRTRLRAIAGGRALRAADTARTLDPLTITGDRLLWEAAQIAARYLRENLKLLAPDDPLRAEIEARIASQSHPEALAHYPAPPE